MGCSNSKGPLETTSNNVATCSQGAKETDQPNESLGTNPEDLGLNTKTSATVELGRAPVGNIPPKGGYSVHQASQDTTCYPSQSAESVLDSQEKDQGYPEKETILQHTNQTDFRDFEPKNLNVDNRANSDVSTTGAGIIAEKDIPNPQPTTEIQLIRERKSEYSELPEFKSLQQIAPGYSDENLYKFYCYRENTDGRLKILKTHLAWRSSPENAWVDNPPLRAHSDPVLKKHLLSETAVLPKEMLDKEGRPCLLLRLRNTDMTDGTTPRQVFRASLYCIERLLQQKEALENGVTYICDLEGITKKNLHIGVPKLIVGALSGEKIPIRIKAFLCVNAPWIFIAMHNALRPFISPKLRKRFVFLKSFAELHEYIDPARLLEEYGGQVKHSQATWVEQQINEELAGNVHLLDCYQKPS